MVNTSPNRGPKSIQGRMRALANLRNVGNKIFTDKEYKDQLWEDGMNYDSQRVKRRATTQVNEYGRQIKKHIIKPRVKNVDAVREWESNQNGLKDSIEVVKRNQKPEFDSRVQNESTPQYRPVKRVHRSPRNYVWCNFHVSGPVNIGPPVDDWLPKPKKSYY